MFFRFSEHKQGLTFALYEALNFCCTFALEQTYLSATPHHSGAFFSRNFLVSKREPWHGFAPGRVWSEGTAIKLKSGKRRGPAQERGLSGAPLNNRLLRALPPEEYSLFAPELELVSFRSRQRLHEPGSTADFIFFPNEGSVSLVLELNDGRSLEVCMVGKEGCVGTAAALGLSSSHLGATVQLPGSGFRIRAELVQDRLPASPALQLFLAQRSIAETLQAAQIAACTRFHRIEQRLARWLLVCRAKTGLERLPFTQEFLAAMLGAGRPSVTLAAGALQKAGAISYNRGTMRIENSSKLEASACDCHRAILESDSELNGE